MDTWSPFQTFTFQEFPFPVDRYEEYIGGRLVAQGNVHFNIKFKQHKEGCYTQGGVITVNLVNNPLDNKILSSFEFDTCITMGDRLMFYIYAQESNVQDVSLEIGRWYLGIYKKTEKLCKE